MEENMASRLKRLREERKLSQRELSRLTGIEQGTLSRIERGEMHLVSPHVKKLSQVLAVSEARLLGIVSNIAPGQVGTRRIPIMDLTQLNRPPASEHNASIGPMTNYVLSDLPHSPDTFAFHIRGDSMEPLFCEGDKVVVDPEVNLRPGDFVVAEVGDGGDNVFRRYRDMGLDKSGNRIFELLPLNPLYPSLRSDLHTLTIRGTMVEHTRYRKS